jgi:hypothetical protein
VVVAERDAAMLSMDEQTIRAYYRKYNGREAPTDMEVFWRMVHKARTAIRTFPMQERQRSKRWLLAHNSEPLDDGDVPI